MNTRNGRSIVRTLLAAAFLFAPLTARAQDGGSETPPGWQKSLVGSFSYAQTSFSNWSQGGEDFSVWVLGVNGGLNKKVESYAWSNELKLEYGLITQGDEKARKAVDQIYFESVYTKHVGWKVEPYVSATLRTQFAEGKDYEADPVTVNSDFWDPVYLTQSAGFEENLNPETVTRLGFSMREVYTDKYYSYSDDKDTPEKEKSKVEAGLESVTKYEGELREGLVAKSKLNLFYSFNQTDQLDVDWASDLSLKVVKNVSVNYSLQIIYDKDVIDKAQVKQFLGVGVSLAFI